MSGTRHCLRALQAGGAIHVGVEAFQASTSEGDAPKVPASSLSAASNATAAQLAVPQPAYGTVR